MESTDEEQQNPAQDAEDGVAGFEDMVALYDESMRNLTEGEIVTGEVIDITDDEVIVDVGYKSEGLIDRDEFTDREGELTVEVGDEVEVLLERTEDLEGHVVLSKQKAERMKIWTEIENSYKEGKIIKGKVVERIKGGLTVDIGIRAFLPGSLADIKPIKSLESLKGEEFEFKVISLDRRRNNVVLSRKAVLEKEFAKQKKETLTKLKEGALLPGVVKNITDYGVFVDLGGIDGLLHITDISWGRVNHPSEHFSVGDDVEVVILKFDPETERVSLGFKQKSEDPWTLVDKKYPLGSRVKGTVVSLVDYGAFVEIEEGVEGLIHVSEMSWTKKVVNPSKMLEVGDEIEAIVSELDMEQRRISLSLRQAERNPWEELLVSHPVGTLVEGKVRNLTEFGAFVEITEEIDGLVHVSDMSWTKRIKHPSEVLTKGDTVQARITHIDVENQRVSLSIKEFLPNEWQTFVNQHSVGEKVTGRVVNVTDFGLFVDIFEGLEGLAHVSEIDVAGDSLEEEFRVGDWVSARILRIEEDEKKVGLTMRGVHQPTEEEAAELQAEWEKDQAPDEEGEEGDEERDSDSDPDAEVGGGEGPSDEDEEVDAGEAESDEDEGDDEEGDDEDEGDGDEGDAEDEDEDEDDDEDDDEEGDAEDEGDGGDEDDVEDEGDDEEGDVEDEDEEGDVEDEDDGDEGDEEEDDEDDGEEEEDEEDEDEEEEGDGSEELEESADEDAEGADESDDEERSE